MKIQDTNQVATLYDLLIYLLGNAKRILSSPEAQINLFQVIHVLKIVISSLKKDITDQSEEKKHFCKRRKCFK